MNGFTEISFRVLIHAAAMRHNSKNTTGLLIRVVRKLQFLNNFLVKSHFCRVGESPRAKKCTNCSRTYGQRCDLISITSPVPRTFAALSAMRFRAMGAVPTARPPQV